MPKAIFDAGEFYYYYSIFLPIISLISIIWLYFAIKGANERHRDRCKRFFNE